MGILGELWVKLGLKNEGLNKGLEQSKQKVSGFAKYMGKLGGMMAAAFSVKQIVAFTHQTAELANKAAGVRKAFEALNKPNLLADLRRATMGTVDDLQLMQRAVQAKNFKIPLDQLATYLQFATKRANETGQSVDYLVDSIITGLGRQSVLILDNLGISAAEIRDNMKDGASMAEAVGKIIKEQMGDAATEIDKAALATGRLSAAWTNFQLAVGDETKGPWNWLKGKAAGALETATQFLTTDNLNFWQKLFTFSPAGLIMKAAGTYERAFAKDAQDAELIGPMPNPNAPIGTPQAKSLIADLQEQIKAKEQLRDLSANPAEIRQLNDEIEALQEKLRLIQMSTKELKKYNEELLAGKNKERGHQSVEQMPAFMNERAMKESIAKTKELRDKAFKDYIAGSVQASDAAIEQQARLLEAEQMLNSAITTGINQGVNELANLIAGVEGANVGNVVKSLLSPLADAAISAGLLVMGVGKAIEAFKTSLTTLKGPTAIVAGAALVAIGMAAKAGLAAIGNGARGGGGYGNQSVTSYSGGYGINSNNYTQNNEFTLTSTLKGQDILLSIQRTQNNNRR